MTSSQIPNERLPVLVRQKEGAAPFPEVEKVLDQLLALNHSWWTFIRSSAPIARAMISLTTPGTAAMEGFRFWTNILRGSNTFIGSIVERRRRKKILLLVKELILSGLYHKQCLSPDAIAIWLNQHAQYRDLFPLESIGGFYLLVQELLQDSSLRLAAEKAGLADNADFFAREIALIRHGGPCAHRVDGDVRRLYSKLLSRAIGAVIAELRLRPAHDDARQFDLVQEAILELIAGVVPILVGDSLTVDLGVNFMHYLKRGTTAHKKAVCDATPASADVYGAWLEEAPGLLLVGPVTDSARPFQNFLVPVFNDSDGRRLLPGAPAAFVREAPQELHARLDWLRDRWPPGLDKYGVDGCKRLSDFLINLRFQYCISFPVLGTLEDRKRLVGVVNVNTTSAPAHMSAAMQEQLYEMLKPLLVLLGWTEVLRHTPSTDDRDIHGGEPECPK